MPGATVDWQLQLDTTAAARHFARHADGAAEAMAELAGEAADDTAPRDRGGLVESRQTTQARDGLAEIVYPVPYAAYQHEDLTLQHAAGQRAKWLELTLAEQRDAMLAAARQELRL